MLDVHGEVLAASTLVHTHVLVDQDICVAGIDAADADVLGLLVSLCLRSWLRRQRRTFVKERAPHLVAIARLDGWILREVVHALLGVPGGASWFAFQSSADVRERGEKMKQGPVAAVVLAGSHLIELHVEGFRQVINSLHCGL